MVQTPLLPETSRLHRIPPPDGYEVEGIGKLDIHGDGIGET